MHFVKTFTHYRSTFASRSGFTLIELLVVTGLLALVVGGSIAGYRRFNDRQLVITAGKELLVSLRQAQSKASSGVRTSPTCTASRLVGYRLSVNNGSLGSYTISESYATNCVSATSGEYVVRTVQLPPGVSFQSAVTLTFTGLSGGVNFSGASPLSLVVCNNSCGSGSLSYRMSVSRSGLIEDLGAQ